MDVTLSSDTEELVKERIARGEYPSAAHLLEVAVQHLLANVGRTGQQERPESLENHAGVVLEPLPSLQGSLPPSWKDDIY